MKKLLLSMVTLAACCLPAFADDDAATITSSPTPAVLGMPVTITINLNGQNYTSDVYLYSWINVDKKYEAASWNDTNVEKFKMTKVDNSTFTFSISDMASFWNIDSSILKNQKELDLNFIAKSDSKQTADLKISAKKYYSGGDGSEVNPWTISNFADLTTLSTNSGTGLRTSFSAMTSSLHPSHRR